MPEITILELPFHLVHPTLVGVCSLLILIAYVLWLLVIIVIMAIIYQSIMQKQSPLTTYTKLKEKYAELFHNDSEDLPLCHNEGHRIFHVLGHTLQFISCNTTAAIIFSVLTGMEPKLFLELNNFGITGDGVNITLHTKDHKLCCNNEKNTRDTKDTNNSSSNTENQKELQHCDTKYVYHYSFIWESASKIGRSTSKAHCFVYYNGSIYQSFSSITNEYTKKCVGYYPIRVVLKNKEDWLMFESKSLPNLTLKKFNLLCMPSTMQLPDNTILRLNGLIKAPVNLNNKIFQNPADGDSLIMRFDMSYF